MTACLCSNSKRGTPAANRQAYSFLLRARPCPGIRPSRQCHENALHHPPDSSRLPAATRLCRTAARRVQGFDHFSAQYCGFAQPQRTGSRKLHLRYPRHAHQLPAGTTALHPGRRQARPVVSQRTGGHRLREPGPAQPRRRSFAARQCLRPQQGAGSRRVAALWHPAPLLRSHRHQRFGRQNWSIHPAGMARGRRLHHAGVSRPDRASGTVPQQGCVDRTRQHLGSRPGLSAVRPATHRRRRLDIGGGHYRARPDQIPQRRRQCADGQHHHAQRRTVQEIGGQSHAHGLLRRHE